MEGNLPDSIGKAKSIGGKLIMLKDSPYQVTLNSSVPLFRSLRALGGIMLFFVEQGDKCPILMMGKGYSQQK